MDSIMHSEVFFFISSIGFIILGGLVAILVVYSIRAVDSFSRILDKIEKDIDTIGDTTKEMIEDVRDSAIFNFIFRKKKKRK